MRRAPALAERRLALRWASGAEARIQLCHELALGAERRCQGSRAERDASSAPSPWLGLHDAAHLELLSELQRGQDRRSMQRLEHAQRSCRAIQRALADLSRQARRARDLTDPSR